jgi:serine/threonine-protein kinase ATR
VVEIVLPPGGVDFGMSFQDKNGNFSQSLQQCRYALHDAADGLWHAMDLLCMLVDISTFAAASHDATPAFQDYLAWMVDYFLSINEMQKRWEADSTLQRSSKESTVLCFRSLYALLSSLQESLSGTIERKGYILLTAMCAELTEDPADLSEELTKLDFCGSLLHLAAVCKQHESVCQAVSLHLVPGIQTILSEGNASLSLSSDFQVRYLRILMI